MISDQAHFAKQPSARFGAHKECPACPVEVRGLYATAHNAVLAFEAAMRGQGDPVRAIRKMAELKDAVALFRPISEAHFADRQHWDRADVNPSAREPVDQMP